MTMQTDELRAELTDLANEVAPFEGDLPAIRRRVARRRMVVGSIAAVFVVVLAGGAIAITRSNSHKVEVAGSTKEVTAAALPRLDATVALAADSTPDELARVREILDTSPSVEHYTVPPADSLAFALVIAPRSAGQHRDQSLCANQSTAIFAVELSSGAPDALQKLTSEIGTDAKVRGLRQGNLRIQTEIFMDLKASESEIRALAERLKTDPDIVSYRFLNHRDAYNEFKKLFADQPVLIQNQKPDSLPESFQLQVRDGVPLDAVAKRYENLPGVDTVNTPSALFGDYPFAKPNLVPDTQACAKTP
jgi:hypothetical protein